MKALGIVGGLGPESTVDYYRLLIARFQELCGRAPSLIIDSLDVQRGIALSGSDLPGLADYLVQSVERLTRAGADFALFAANTPHIVFDEVQRRSTIPLLSIVAAAADRVATMGVRRVGLLGTRFTMQGGFYPPAFAARGVEVVVPDADAIAAIHHQYIHELIPGIFLDSTRQAIAGHIERLRDRDRIEAVVLAGTELPLLLRETKLPLPVLDTAIVHVEAAVARLAEEA